jgi:hypothetical protein
MMIRKQLYIGAEQQRKLRHLATRWGCSEAEVVRRAVDRLEEPGNSFLDRLRTAGLLVEVGDVTDLPSASDETTALDKWFEDWLATRTEPLGLSEAVMEDRR